MRRHYRLGLLVDDRCADAPGADDLRRWAQRPREGGMATRQPVAGQGEDGENAGFGVGPFGETPFGDPT